MLSTNFSRQVAVDNRKFISLDLHLKVGTNQQNGHHPKNRPLVFNELECVYNYEVYQELKFKDVLVRVSQLRCEPATITADCCNGVKEKEGHAQISGQLESVLKLQEENGNVSG